MSVDLKRGSKGKEGTGKGESRVSQWSGLLHSLTRLLWVLVVIAVLIVLGRLTIFKSPKADTGLQPRDITIVEKVDWDQVDREVREVMAEAREETAGGMEIRIDDWIAAKMERVDSEFLPWYFSYWTQQKLGIEGLLSQVVHWINSGSPSAAEAITETVQLEFANRVIRPQIAQLELERIINEVISSYTENLQNKLKKIPEEYRIEPAAWDRYLTDISVMVAGFEANRQVPVSLKALAGLTAGGTLVLFQSLRPALSRLGAGVSSKLAAKTSARMATKTGGKVAGKLGGKFLGVIIGIGVIIWDVWDHHRTVQTARPVLRQNILDYMQELKQSLLNDPEYGIMTIIYGLEKELVRE
jgi:hypothetical protein